MQDNHFASRVEPKRTRSDWRTTQHIKQFGFHHNFTKHDNIMWLNCDYDIYSIQVTGPRPSFLAVPTRSNLCHLFTRVLFTRDSRLIESDFHAANPAALRGASRSARNSHRSTWIPPTRTARVVRSGGVRGWNERDGLLGRASRSWPLLLAFSVLGC